MLDPKSRHLGTIAAQLCWAISSQLRHISTVGKILLSSNMSSTCPHNMVNLNGLLAAEICWRMWGTPSNFKGFRVLAMLLHDTLVVGVSQTLRHWTEVPPIFGRAAITLGIGPHSSCICCCCVAAWFQVDKPTSTVRLNYPAFVSHYKIQLWLVMFVSRHQCATCPQRLWAQSQPYHLTHK